MCLCLFIFGIKRRKNNLKICCRASLSRPRSILALFVLSSPPHPPFIKNIRLADNVDENTYFFYSCLSVSVVCHQPLPAFVSLCLRPSRLELPVSFRTTRPARPFLPLFSLLMYLSVCSFSPDHLVLCLFSVSELFVPFSVSFLSLLGPCVEGGRRRPSALCG